jgi:chromosome partitioning protein
MRFLNSLDIPLVTTLRDAQNYVRSAETGLGIHEMPEWQVRQDLVSWEPIGRWLQERQFKAEATPPEEELVSIV